MNTTPTMTLERTDAAASAPRTERTPTTGGFQTYEPWIEVTASLGPRYDEILTPEALAFLAELHDRFAHTRHELLAVRLQTRVDAANGRDPKFLPETEWIRNDPSWRVAGAGPGLEDRRIHPHLDEAIQLVDATEARTDDDDLVVGLSPTRIHVLLRLLGQVDVVELGRVVLQHVRPAGLGSEGAQTSTTTGRIMGRRLVRS